MELDLFGNSSLLASISMSDAQLVCSNEPLRTAIKKPFAVKRLATNVDDNISHCLPDKIVDSGHNFFRS